MADFINPDGFRSLIAGQPVQDTHARAAAADRNAQLTKPPGALGDLETLAQWYAGWRGDARPRIKAPQIIVFAGNHGVAARGVSAFPPEVTAQMVLNFEHGGAAINQLARAADARLDVHALDLDRPTQDFTQVPAMTDAELTAALTAGWDAVRVDSDVLVVGEMGIGNTTSAAAIACALYGGPAAGWTGRGTGVDDAGVDLKTQVVADAVALHGGQGDGIETLRRLGGREMAAMVGAIARARLNRIPVILDGFICTAAAACLEQAVTGALDHCIAGHQSDESGHAELLHKLGKTPILSLGLRLGEASGAALAISILKAAVECHSGMSTFAEAGVSGG
ncbi:nicotinate-nucleotide--dimethylbenzimidazole phosphoribosyltransferase [uncultured Sulfitobacter sp.]|uniref:nicotinate-nucleotide--dimethylbenzimidazole phosphoribosyltransferase n=1 Tax=uncultured Sulfitobacter sp. TaxID=191468 RepID=UPI00261804ED|nr:nicotinate-nucleotide--dimethylbenzimidazole phosphoribosyltransferase [uncultured Sulfitobacter sp.]